MMVFRERAHLLTESGLTRNRLSQEVSNSLAPRIRIWRLSTATSRGWMVP
jgi:hypothetical protein